MNWPYPRIVAHRGGGTLAPENTLGAIKLGAAMGFKGVEFDVMLSGDGVPVVIHDETVDRTTNGKGSVPGMTFSEMKKLNAGNGETIPGYEEAVKLCRELGLWANVEIKPAKGHERATGEAVARMTADLWQGAPLAPLLSSFSVEALEAAKAAAPEVARGYLVGRIPKDWKATMERLECRALHCNRRALKAKLAAAIREAGYGILCWTVNDRRQAHKLLGMGASCIVTDRLDRIPPGFA